LGYGYGYGYGIGTVTAPALEWRFFLIFWMFHRIYMGLEGFFFVFFLVLFGSIFGFGFGFDFVSDIHWRYSFSFLGFQYLLSCDLISTLSNTFSIRVMILCAVV